MIKSYVYRCYDGNKLIYIGCTRDTKRRFSAHKTGSDWWVFVTETVIDEYPGWTASLAEESLIDTFNPTFNQKGKGRSSIPAIEYMTNKGWGKPYFRSNGSPVFIYSELPKMEAA